MFISDQQLFITFFADQQLHFQLCLLVTSSFWWPLFRRNFATDSLISIISWHFEVLFLRLSSRIPMISCKCKRFFDDFGKDFWYFRIFSDFCCTGVHENAKKWAKNQNPSSNLRFLWILQKSAFTLSFLIFSWFLQNFFQFFVIFRGFSWFWITCSLKIDHLSVMK